MPYFRSFSTGLLISLLLASAGCGNIVRGDGYRVDHWGPLPVLCVGYCDEAFAYPEQYYYNGPQQKGRSPTATTPPPPAQ